jgi:hypothetical protein
MNDQVECEGNGDRFLQHQRRNLYWMGTWRSNG